MKTLQEIKKEIEANQEVKRANDAEREKADNAAHPVFIETPDDTAKIMLCTCRNK